MRSLRGQRLGRSSRKVRVPNALPFFFTGLQAGRLARRHRRRRRRVLRRPRRTASAAASRRPPPPPHYAPGVGLRRRRRSSSAWCSTWPPSLLERVAMPWQARRSDLSPTTDTSTAPTKGRDTHEKKRMSRGVAAAARAGRSSRPPAAATARAARARPPPRRRGRGGHGRGDGDRGERRSRHDGTPAPLKPVKLQLQWVTQAQFAGYFAAVDQGFYKDEGLDVADPRGRRRHRAADGAGPGQRRLRHRLGAEGAASRARPAPTSPTSRQIFQRSGTLQVSLQGQEHHRRRPTSRARRSATGASATSTSCSPA